MMPFRILTDDEEKEFRKWARDNYKVGDEIKYGLWHPIVVHEAYLMCKESFASTT